MQLMPVKYTNLSQIVVVFSVLMVCCCYSNSTKVWLFAFTYFLVDFSLGFWDKTDANCGNVWAQIRVNTLLNLKSVEVCGCM